LVEGALYLRFGTRTPPIKICCEMGNGLGQIEIAGVFQGFDPRDFSLVRPPVHPLGLGRKLIIEIRIVRSAKTVAEQAARIQWHNDAVSQFQLKTT
jgi:hypothetical protein